jgi:Mg2+/Co2+ transporter CorB
MTFFKGNDVVWQEKIDKAIGVLRTEFELALLKQKQAFEEELEAMETNILDRLQLVEKTSRSNSLQVDTKAQQETDAAVVNGGYQTWSQRKAKRILATSEQGGMKARGKPRAN